MRIGSLAAVLLVLASCSGSSVEGDVLMSSSQRFVPAALDVVVGEKVTFANDSKEAHTVTAYEEDLPEGVAFFASGGAQDEQAARDDLGPGLIDPGETFEVTFDQPGTYRYFCIPHESVGMAGTIVVTEP